MLRFFIEFALVIGLMRLVPTMWTTVMDCLTKMANILVKGLRSVFNLDGDDKNVKPGEGSEVN